MREAIRRPVEDGGAAAVNAHPGSDLLVLLVIALFAVSLAMLFFVAASATISAIGLAQENGRGGLALLWLLLPPAGWLYLFRHGRPARWLSRYLVIGLLCLAVAAGLMFALLPKGISLS